MAPIVRTGADGERELVMARWGMPGPPGDGDMSSVWTDTGQLRVVKRIKLGLHETLGRITIPALIGVPVLGWAFARKIVGRFA